MALNNFDDDQYNSNMGLGGESEPEPTPEPEKKPSGRNFLLAIGILGVILLLALILLLLVAPKIIAQQQANQLEQVAQINAKNTATALAATNQAIKAQATATLQAVLLTKTPVVVLATSTPQPGAERTLLSPNELATVHALQTQMAGGGTTYPAPTSTALPTTGFADEFGLPGILGLAAVLIAVVFISRKLRTSAH